MTKTKDEVLQEIFNNDPMGILDGNFETKKLPDNWWDKGINPILGYKYEPISTTRAKRNKFEYPEHDDYKVDDGVIAYFTRQTRSKTDNNNE